VEEPLADGAKGRQDEWTGSAAVGSKFFIASVKASLGFGARGRDVIESDEGYQLRESPAPHMAFFEAENEDIAPKNTVFWDVNESTPELSQMLKTLDIPAPKSILSVENLS
jgi:hypothetical protein